ncbi:family 43 glycosylhydrolase [Paenibacillus taichungensis]|uniref:family 43 glycosylhydrolase n=1 Tax=Paenibacillus taichungensis TaxID=484184 RepID=UPI0039A3F41D
MELIQSTRLSQIDEGKRKIIWSPEPGGRYSHHLWAPEIHFLNGKWYIYYTANDGEGTIHGGFACWRMKAQIPWMEIGYGRGLWTLLSRVWMVPC